jgi:hypothetical protein
MIVRGVSMPCSSIYLKTLQYPAVQRSPTPMDETRARNGFVAAIWSQNRDPRHGFEAIPLM